MKLKLNIETEWTQHEFFLDAQDIVIVGRSPDAQVPVPRASVSTEHLKITWTGHELQIADLKSSNGTFRMPQDSPFYEASFAPRYDGLELRVSKSLIKLSWAPDSATQATVQLTSTEMVSPTVLKPSGEPRSLAQQKIAAPESPVLEPLANKADTPPKQVRAIQIERVSRAQARQSAVSIVLFLSGLMSLLISWFGAKWLLRGLMTAPLSQLKSGGFKDLIIVLVGFWVRSPLWCVGATVLIFLSIVWTLKCVHKERFVWAKDLVGAIYQAGFAPCVTPFSLGLLLWAGSGSWPFLWPLVSGVNMFPTIGPAVQVWTLSRKTNVDDRIKILTDLSDSLKGSSLVYKQMLMINRARALDECKGQGTTAPWEQKKVCLLLLAAVGIEAYEQMQPAVVQELAARASILLVLDGVTRIVEVDGPDSTLIEFFFASLAGMGLEAEASDIKDILNRKDLDVESRVSTLRDLRRRVESQLDLRFRRLDLPQIFYFQIPGPLESGI